MNARIGSGPAPVRDDFAVNGRHGRQFWVHAQSGPNGLSYLSGKPDTNRLSETILICRVAAQCFQDPVQAGLRPSEWRCAGRARRSHPARSESRNSGLLCGKCSTACEKVSPQARRSAPSRGGASADGQTTLVKRQQEPVVWRPTVVNRNPSNSAPRIITGGSILGPRESHTRSPGRPPPHAATGAAWKWAVLPELYWRDSEEDRYATEIAGDKTNRKAARGGRTEAQRLAAAWVAAAGYLEPPLDRLFQFFPGRPGV